MLPKSAQLFAASSSIPIFYLKYLKIIMWISLDIYIDKSMTFDIHHDVFFVSFGFPNNHKIQQMKQHLDSDISDFAKHARFTSESLGSSRAEIDNFEAKQNSVWIHWIQLGYWEADIRAFPGLRVWPRTAPAATIQSSSRKKNLCNCKSLFNIV